MGSERDRKVKRRLGLAALLTGIIFFVELAGGWLTNSLALISDAVHVFMDVFALMLSWFAIYISALPPTEKRTYGLHRVEVFVSFINGFTLVIISFYIIYKAFFRFINPLEVESVGMFVVAVAGMVVNGVVALWLREHAREDLNVRSAFLHVIGDAAASAGVIGGAVIIYITGLHQVDPVISVLISIVILAGAGRIIMESSHILLEGVPRDIDLREVLENMKSVKGVKGVHSLHIWSICHNTYALSAHVDIESPYRDRHSEILREITERLARKHHIFYTTLQPECAACATNDILRTIEHRERGHVH